MFTIVIDTNVLIDATTDLSGYAHQVIELVIGGKLNAVASRRIEDEYRALIVRVVSVCARQELDEFFDVVERVRVHERAAARVEDREDQKFLDCAVVAGANYLITNDRHLRDVGMAGTTKIVTPQEFIAIFNSQRDPEGKREWQNWVKQLFSGQWSVYQFRVCRGEQCSPIYVGVAPRRRPDCMVTLRGRYMRPVHRRGVGFQRPY